MPQRFRHRLLRLAHTLERITPGMPRVFKVDNRLVDALLPGHGLRVELATPSTSRFEEGRPLPRPR
ncbi:hypothetical protein [Nocardioides zeae]|uniref:Uncharacterized protein n=1 Tax=Nocardioides zeae TaxID=1457234 RepID=A0AAJ1X208_9ACTN|nr:hypothetical protein [Nocardioides zeae]MDQ1105441.1 hypothetical protein [Nocardioides zeae]